MPRLALPTAANGCFFVVSSCVWLFMVAGQPETAYYGCGKVVFRLFKVVVRLRAVRRRLTMSGRQHFESQEKIWT